MAHSRQRGVALLTALIVAFVAIAIGMQLGARQQTDIHRTEALRAANRAAVRLGDLERAAFVRVIEDRAEGLTGYLGPRDVAPLDALGDAAAADIGMLEDLQGRFNVNDLAGSAVAQARFRRLLVALSLDPDLADALIDWIDVDSDRRIPGGAEDDVYTRLDPPYRAANRPLTRISELRLVRGFDADVYTKLAPYLCALPRDAGLNINVADRLQIAALDDELNDTLVDAIIDRRETRPFDSFEDLRQMEELQGINIDAWGINWRSRHFLLHALVRQDGREYRMATQFEATDERYEVAVRYPEEQVWEN